MTEERYFKNLLQQEIKPWNEAEGLKPETLESLFSSEKLISRLLKLNANTQKNKVEYGLEIVRNPEYQKLQFGKIVSGELIGDGAVDLSESSANLKEKNELLHTAITIHTHPREYDDDFIIPSVLPGDLSGSHQRRVALHTKRGLETVMPTIDLISMAAPNGNNMRILGYHESLKTSIFNTPTLPGLLEEELLGASSQEEVVNIMIRYGYTAILAELNIQNKSFDQNSLSALRSLAYINP
jgi:hypothetical protein